MSFKGFGEIAQELEEFSGRLVGQLERDADDRQIIRFHGARPSSFVRFVLCAGFGVARRTLLCLLETIACKRPPKSPF
jgi:hypothetical protein